MPKAYYQCPKCKRGFSTTYKMDETPPTVECGCKKKPVPMTYRGDGWDGRENWPHGKPRRKN